MIIMNNHNYSNFLVIFHFLIFHPIFPPQQVQNVRYCVRGDFKTQPAVDRRGGSVQFRAVVIV